MEHTGALGPLAHKTINELANKWSTPGNLQPPERKLLIARRTRFLTAWLSCSLQRSLAHTILACGAVADHTFYKVARRRLTRRRRRLHCTSRACTPRWASPPGVGMGGIVCAQDGLGVGAVPAPKAGEKGLAKSGGRPPIPLSWASCPGEASAECQPRRGGGGEAEEEHGADVTATASEAKLLPAQERSSHCGGVGGDKVRLMSPSCG